MIQDRIEINGVWYIKENIVDKQEKDFELSFSLQATHENDKYCWEATRLYKGNDRSGFFENIDIKFTDKRVKPWKKELWDSNEWFRDVLNNDPEAMPDARKSMCDDGIKTFQLFLKKLKEEGWL